MQNKSLSLRRYVALCATSLLLLSHNHLMAQISNASAVNELFDVHDPAITSPCINDASFEQAYTINCDMMQVPGKSKLVGVVASGMNHQNYVCCSFPFTCYFDPAKPLTLMHLEYFDVSHLFVPHSNDILLPTDQYGNPDIVIGDKLAAGPNNYRVATVFNAPNHQDVQLAFIDATIATTGNSTLSGLSSAITLNDASNGRIASNARIDLFGDYTTMYSNIHVMHKYIAVWSEENISTGVHYIMAAVGDLSNPASFTRYQITPNNPGDPQGIKPDVGALGAWSALPVAADRAFITYYDPSTANNAVMVSTLTLTSTPTITTFNYSGSGYTYSGSPRIEAQALGPITSGRPWGLVASATNVLGRHFVHNVVGASTYSFSLSATDNQFSPCITTVGQNMMTSASGITTGNYSLAYYTTYTNNSSATNGDIFVNKHSYVLGASTNYYEANTGDLLQPSAYTSATNIPVAISSTSNTGDDNLVVWYSGWDPSAIPTPWGYLHYKMTGNGYNFRTTSVNELNADAEFNAYPNPATDELNLEVSNVSPNAVAILTDITGKTLRHQSINNRKTVINISDITPGMYMLQYQDDNNKKSIKVVKQ
jgi:hypothetical protein